MQIHKTHHDRYFNFQTQIERCMNHLIEQSKQLREQAKELLKWQSFNNKPTIVVYGLMNAGKSYLLNMLTEHIDSEYFKTNDFRETTENKAFETDACIFLDTPGLDANDDDNIQALEGIKQADIVLFVHQLQGELEKVEIDFLQHVVDSFGDYASDNIIMVLSKVDKESTDKVNQIQTRVLEQCQHHLGFSPKCFQISNTRYQKGVIEHKDGLIKHSHVLELNERLTQIVKNDKQVRQTRMENDKHAIKEKLINHLRLLSQERRQVGKEMLEPLHKTQDVLKDIAKYIKDEKERLTEVQHAINNIEDKINELKQ